MTIPNKVLVVKGFNTTGANLIPGHLVAIDGATGSIITAAQAANVQKLQFGLVKRAAIIDANPAKCVPAYIVKTKAFTRDEVISCNSSFPTPAVEDQYELKLSGLKTAVNNSPLAVLQVTIMYKLDARSAKKEESYTLRIADFATDTLVAGRVADLITRNPHSWADAVAVGSTVTITAKTAIDHQPGAKLANSPFSYNQTKMNVSAFHQDSESVLANISTSGITVDRVAVATPGMNNPFVIRDQEKAAAGYDSAHFSHVYPNQIAPTGLALTQNGEIDDSVAYAGVTFAVDIKYRAADSNYMKTTTVYNSIYGDENVFDAVAVKQIIDGTYVPN